MFTRVPSVVRILRLDVFQKFFRFSFQNAMLRSYPAVHPGLGPLPIDVTLKGYFETHVLSFWFGDTLNTLMSASFPRRFRYFREHKRILNHSASFTDAFYRIANMTSGEDSGRSIDGAKFDKLRPKREMKN